MKRIFIICFCFLFIFSCISCDYNYEKGDKEVVKFLIQDKTFKKEYIEGEYVCGHFAIDIVDNAREKGFQAWVLEIGFPNQDLTHAIVVFRTINGYVLYEVTTTLERIEIDYAAKKYTALTLEGKKLYETEIEWAKVFY